MRAETNAAHTWRTLPWRRIVIGAVALLGASCARLPNTGVTPLKTENLAELKRELLTHPSELKQFRARGPFEVTVREDVTIAISPSEHIEADLYLSSAPGKAPLVLILHGYDNGKEDHAYQALHLATWGMHAAAIQLAKEGPWVANGERLVKLVRYLRKHPEAIDPRIDGERIVLVGHSFGATSVAIALAEGAPAAGGILLDPASDVRGLQAYLKKVRAPVMVLAADARMGLTRARGDFYEFIPSGVAEVSIAEATHEDATFPLDAALQLFSDTTEDIQLTFVAALTSSAMSLGLTGKLDYAWSSFDDALKSGKLYDALRKR